MENFDTILILDFGGQYTQLIAKCIRSLSVYCEIIPYNHPINWNQSIKGIILSGSHSSVNSSNAPSVSVEAILQKAPVLGICYGAQLAAQQLGGVVEKTFKREYGSTLINRTTATPIFNDVPTQTTVWMSHSDTILKLPPNFSPLATTANNVLAAYEAQTQSVFPLYGVQFHPEVFHTEHGKQIIQNFILDICHCKQDWQPQQFVNHSIAQIKTQVGNQKLIMALSGGVDSTVAAVLIAKAIGKQFAGIFVDNGLLRKNEYQNVLAAYHSMGLNVHGIDAKAQFYQALEGVTDPEEKRKVIGKLFISIFDSEAKKQNEIAFLGQGTIYPDVIESQSVFGPSAVIKSHHNVGGLPTHMQLKLIEPLRLLFKDEVRNIGQTLDIPSSILKRHPFPGPGLAIRIIGSVNAERVALLQAADELFMNLLQKHNLMDTIWQAGAILLPIKTVGVMGDERSYENVLALRAVTSTDGMTADWAPLPHSFLATVSNEIISKVKGINRVVYDISSKPPATIEWE